MALFRDQYDGQTGSRDGLKISRTVRLQSAASPMSGLRFRNPPKGARMLTCALLWRRSLAFGGIALCLCLSMIGLPRSWAASIAQSACQNGLACMELFNMGNSGDLSVLKDSNGWLFPVADAGKFSSDSVGTWTADVGTNSDSSFTLKNSGNPGKCLDANSGTYIYTYGGIGSDWRAMMYDCNGTDRQRWFFQPTDDGSVFYIRNVATRHCLSLYSDTHTVQHSGCDHTDRSSKWFVIARPSGDQATYARNARALAIAYAGTYCTSNPNTCDHAILSTSTPTPDGQSCDSAKIVHNLSGAEEKIALTKTTVSSFEHSYTQNISVTLGTGANAFMKVEATASFGSSQVWTDAESQSESRTISLPDKWYAVSMLERITVSVTAKYTFDLNGPLPWSATDTAKILVTGPGGGTEYRDVTSPNPPLCDGGTAHAPGLTVAPTIAKHLRNGTVVDPNSQIQSGDLLLIAVTLQNHGDTALRNISIDDVLESSQNGPARCPGTALAPNDSDPEEGASINCFIAHTVSPHDVAVGAVSDRITGRANPYDSASGADIGPLISTDTTLNVPLQGALGPSNGT